MPMTYLRKTATYTVRSADGHQHFVDEFESQTHPGSGSISTAPVIRRLLLRNGDPVSFIDNHTFQLERSGEALSVIRKE